VLAAAVLAGNTVVLKPAPATTLVGLRMARSPARRACRRGRERPGRGRRASPPRSSTDPRVGKIVFTGSVATGKKVMAAAART
jgi:acyl-CoA reductase-like NAD-dependent aldehyde dehydrogenase